MALIKSFKSHTPEIHPSAKLAENATIIGEAEIGEESSIWYNAVLRGDVGAIKIGKRSNIQDGAILHCSTGLTPCIVGDEVVVGHNAILHGCTVEDQVLIGMGAIVLDEVVVPKHTIIAANALVKQGAVLEGGYMYAGTPAKKIKALSESQIEMIRSGALHYVENAKLHWG